MSKGDQSDHYDKYLASMHAKLVTPDNIIADVIKEGTGKQIDAKQRIISGEVNEVYDVTLNNGQHVILRISHRDDPDFLQEQWAIQQCKKVNVPVPEIILIKHLTWEGKQLSFCLMEKMFGDLLERGEIDFENLNLETKKNLIKQAGQILSKIHSIPTTGFGWIVGQGSGQFETANNLITDLLNKEEYYKQIAEEENFDKNKITQIWQIIKNFQELYSKVKPCLSHGDYFPKHFLVKNDKIVGILDWGGIRSDSYIYDFANWEYYFEGKVPMKWLLEGYGGKQKTNKEFNDFLHMAKLVKGTGIFYWYHTEKYQTEVENAKRKLLQDLAYFK